MNKLIENRRSVRKYKDLPLDKKVINEILKAGRLAPSAKNRQPWNFVVLQGDSKNEVTNLMLKYADEPEKLTLETEKQKCKSSVKSTARVILQAPVLVLVFKEKAEEWNIGDNLSIGACIENMLLQALELNVDSLWIRDTYCVAKELAEKYNQDKELVCSVAFGYGAEAPTARPRKPMKDIVTWIQ